MSNSKRKSLVVGVGINDAPYSVHEYHYVEQNGTMLRKKLWSCPYYDAWKDMLSRCYGSEFHKTTKGSAYLDCSVDKSWHTFSNFRFWMSEQVWLSSDVGKLCLDKDIIRPGNKVYSKDSCFFIPGQINKLLLTRQAMRGEYPIGVSLHACGKYMARCSSFGTGRNYLGLYLTCKEAHRAWQSAKIVSILSAIDWYRGLDCYSPTIEDGCLLRVTQLRFDLSSDVETVTF